MKYKSRSELNNDKEFILATIRRRFYAFLIDWIIIVLIYLGIMTLLSLFDLAISDINVHGIFEVELEMENAHAALITVLKIIFGLLPVLYFALSLYFWRGKTLGKSFLRLKVLSLYHERLGLWHCIERSLGYFASALEFGFGFIQAYWNPNRMTLHDKIAETIVVDLHVNKTIVSRPASAIAELRPTLK